MSILLIKAGALDTIQDQGRYGYKHEGVNPNGAMCRFDAALANLSVGNAVEEAVLEMHYPAPIIRFEQAASVALSGADFSARLDGKPMPLNKCVVAPAGALLRFEGPPRGAWCYLALREKFNIQAWKGSYSTNLAAEKGGFEGRRLREGDRISYREGPFLPGDARLFFHPKSLNPNWGDPFEANQIAFLRGNEYEQLKPDAQAMLTQMPFTVAQPGRMGYKMSGPPLQRSVERELLSTAADFGLIQLLPGGGLIILTADHQTSGGYPRIGHVISAHRNKLCQMQAQSALYFVETHQALAETLYIKQQRHLKIIQWAYDSGL